MKYIKKTLTGLSIAEKSEDRLVADYYWGYYQ